MPKLKLLLMFAILFGLTAVLRAQDGGTPKPAAPAQPIAFNHKLHIQTAKLECNDCHEPRGDGSTLSMPQPPKCMLCHASVATDKPDIQRLAAAAKNEDTIPWVRVYRVPSFVTFSHKTHTASGNKCEECHGPVAERTAIALERPTSMGSCISCHSAKQAPTGCDTCHGIMSKNGHSPFDADTVVMARLQVHSGKIPAYLVSAARDRIRPSGQFDAMVTFLRAPSL